MRNPHAEFPYPHAESAMRAAECGVRNAGCGIRNAESAMRNAEFAVRNTHAESACGQKWKNNNGSAFRIRQKYEPAIRMIKKILEEIKLELIVLIEIF